MQKQTIVYEISSKLTQMGIANQSGNGTDISIAAEFLDAGWSTGNKRITYEAMIFADESSNTVFMWEMTREVGQGFSFGGGSESSFQSGKTLFRKVKSIQYGVDGKAYEYSLDLGAIPKAAKESAKQYGWKFKTVLKREKAAWPVGYVPVQMYNGIQQQNIGGANQQPQQQVYGQQPQPSQQMYSQPPQGVNQQPQPPQQEDNQPVQPPYNRQTQPQQQPQPPYSQPPQQVYTAQPQNQQSYYTGNNAQGQFLANGPRKKSSKGGSFGLIGFIILGIIMLLMLAVGKATMTGWIASGIIFAVTFLIQRLLSKRGCLLNLILWVITGFVLLVVLTATSTDGFNFTTANLKNAHMTTAVDSGGKPVDSISTYSVNAPELVAAAELRNAPSNTKVRFVWIYVSNNITITEFTVDSGDKGTDIFVFSSLTNDKPWPEGEYKVEMYIEDRKVPDAAVNFTIGAATQAAAVNTAGGSNETKAEKSGNNKIDGKWVSSSGKVTDIVELEGEEEAALIRAFKEDEDNLGIGKFGFTIEGGVWSQVYFYETALGEASASVSYEEGKVEFISKELVYYDGGKQRYELSLTERDEKLKGTLKVVYNDAKGSKTAVLDVEFKR